ncbi:MAG: TrbG/VirB9 family P-type conjugative transfer protein [Cyanobacteria bacterium SZAS LIN-2]|nr:TrbG/VirB9 family P-type conjugative transfer protein [Cyanobacteria bacterium SZAS LIN-2]
MNAGVGVLVLAALALAASTSSAEVIPPKGRGDPRIRTVTYDSNEVIRIDGYVGYHLHLEFAPGETFVNLGAGDIGGLEVGAEGNHLFLKPKDPRISTNLTILTNRHVYSIDYRVSRKPPEESTLGVVYSLKFTYPEEIAAKGVPEPDPRSGGQRALNRDYWFCGAPTLRPLRAFDDGVQTRLTFPARAEIPAVFVRNDDGTESLVNSSIEADQLVLHRVAAKFVLRRGQLVGCVTNRSYSGGGERLPTGTVSESVERTTVGGTP